jgi:hypothetical protein
MGREGRCPEKAQTFTFPSGPGIEARVALCVREGDRQWTPCVGCYGVGPIGRHPELFPFFRFGAPGSSYSPATALIKSNIYAISESLLVQPRLRWESCCPQEFRRRVLWVMGT